MAPRRSPRWANQPGLFDEPGSDAQATSPGVGDPSVEPVGADPTELTDPPSPISPPTSAPQLSPMVPGNDGVIEAGRGDLSDTLVDGAARDTIAHELDVTLFVEAGAGAGKTSALTSRIVSLVVAGIPISAIAAITFTEKAAADLRRRVRQALESSPEPAARTALAELDAAAIGTLHAFAGRVLREFPVEAGLPPAFSVLDEVGSDMAFDSRWTAYQEELLTDEQRGQLVLYADAEGMGLAGLRDIARGFGDNWDLVEDRVALTAPEPAPPDVAVVGRRLLEICSSPTATGCPEGDSMAAYLDDLRSVAQRLIDVDDQFAAIELVRSFAFSAPTRKGSQAVWGKQHPQGAAALLELRDELADAKKIYDSLIDRFRSAWLPTIGAELGSFTLAAAIERRRLGELEFHDLLVLARNLVRDRTEVRRLLHRRYKRLLLDEFQDTDPIQLELAVWLAADPDIDQPDDWRGVMPLPGRLFFVGDPKQSIYRFRRADIGQFLRARDQVGAELATLRTNFRSTPAVLDWVNAVFSRLIIEAPDEQPGYTPLAPFHIDDDFGTVTVLGALKHDDEPDAEEIRRREAADVVRSLQAALSDGWLVSTDAEQQTADGGVDSGRRQRPCQLGDIAILVPARTSLPALQDALLDAGIPFQAENASLVYATAEVRSLLLALRAIDDLTDELALVSTLRSALFGCSDVDLYAWKASGGGWRLDRANDGDDGPVSDAFVVLRELVEQRHWLTPSELLGRLVEHCRVFEVALTGGGYRDSWRRVRFLIDQARAWSDAGGWGLRNYLAWTRRQGDDGRYVAEAVLPETDLDAVRIMTIHAAKGLEFPIVIVSGLSTKVGGARRTRGPIWPPGTWTLSSTEAHEAFQPIDEQLNRSERLRLLYVACTRAESHLVVSLHRKADADGPGISGSTLAELLAAASTDVPAATLCDASPYSRATPEAVEVELAWSDADIWEAARRESNTTARRPRVLAATTVARSPVADESPLDPGLDKDAVDVGLPPWQRGRYGSAVGRAVHGVLQSIDFRTGADLDTLVGAQSAAEGILGREDVVAQLTRSALASPTIQLAAVSQCWRELYVAAPIGDVIIEGYVDLLVRGPDGLILVDYKTDHIANDETLTRKVELYGRQLAAYGIALEHVLGEPVVDARLVLCSPDGGRDVTISRWRDLVAALADELSAAATSVESNG